MTSERVALPDAAKRLYLMVMYEGPWERLTTWALAIDPHTHELKREVSSWKWHWRNLASQFTDWRHRAWLERWATRDAEPPARWARRVSRERPSPNWAAAQRRRP